MKYAIFTLALLYFLSTAHGTDIEAHVVQSEYQNGEQEIRVLVPDDYSKDKSCRVLYVLPVEKGFRTKFGYGLDILRKMDAHNRYGLILVQMGFEKEPWFGDHAANLKVRQASYVKEFVVPFIEQRYSTLGTPEGRLLLGFSKSGWGAFSLIMVYPEFFGYAAAWDSPMMFDRFYWGMESVYGTIEQLRKFQFDQLAPKQKLHFQKKNRLVLTGEELWGTMIKTPTGKASHTVEAHMLLEKEGIKHYYDRSLKFPHRWHKGWMEPTLEALMSLTESGQAKSEHEQDKQ